MKACDLFKLALMAMLLAGSAQAQQAAAADVKNASADQGDTKGGKGGGKGNDSKEKAGDAAAEPCVVHPGDSTKGEGGDSKTKDKSGGAKDNSDKAGNNDKVVVKAGNKQDDAKDKKANKQSPGDATAQNKRGKPQSLDFLTIPLSGTNAKEIAPKLPLLSDAVVSAEPVGTKKIEVVLDSSKVNGTALETLKNNLKTYAQALELENPEVIPITLPPGTNEACEVAHALADAIPGIEEITAVGDSRLVVTMLVVPAEQKLPADEKKKRADELEEGNRKRIEEFVKELAAPVTAPSFHVESQIQRLYYIHDAAAVATLINNAFPNVEAQALLPDRVILSDAVDEDKEKAYEAVKAAVRTIAVLDQPHPQVQVDAWSLQLSTTDTSPKHTLDTKVHELEDTASSFDTSLNESLKAGWTVLSKDLGDPMSLDPLLREYITSATHICPPRGSHGLEVQRWERPYAGQDCENLLTSDGRKAALTAAGTESGKSMGYGLGYTTLYYPLTPNLIDMLVTLISLRNPRSATVNVINAMEGRTKNGIPAADQTDIHFDGDNSKESCRTRDEKWYERERHPTAASTNETEEGGKEWNPPSALQMECVYDAMMWGVLAKQEGDGPMGTSALGQIRSSLVDFLYRYKQMVRYPNEFEAYLEPLAADTLDSSMTPIVDAFNEDLAAFQNEMQDHVRNKLGRNRKLSYGYGGVVSVKVLGEVEADVVTATQNYFDATPPVTLNDVLSSLQAEGAATAKSPLPALLRSLGPAKAVELTTALGQAFSPKPTTAELGRGLNLTVTAHTLSGAYGAELDLKVQSTENGGGLSQIGSSTKTDDLNSRVSQHTVSTKVRVDSLKLFKVSTLGSTLARGRQPWELVDPVRIPLLGPLVKVPRKPAEVYSQSMVFVDTFVIPTAADLGFGVPVAADLIACDPEFSGIAGEKPDRKERSEYGCAWGEGHRRDEESDRKAYTHAFRTIYSLADLPNGLGNRIEQYHGKIVDCLNREYIGNDGTVRVGRGYWKGASQEEEPCYSAMNWDLGNYDSVR